MNDVDFTELTAFERTSLTYIEAFCGQCENVRYSSNPSGFISATKMVIKESGHTLFFFCPIPQHQGTFREVDALFRMKRILARKW